MLGLLDQHDGLRMRYERGTGTGTSGSNWRQWCEAEMNESVYERKDLSGMEDEEEQRRELRRDAEQVQGSLDLGRGRLVKAVEYELGRRAGKKIAVDDPSSGGGWSVVAHSGGRSGTWATGSCWRGEELEFGPKTTSYQQWAAKLQGYGASAGVREELEYWAQRRAESRSKVAAGRGGEKRVRMYSGRRRA